MIIAKNEWNGMVIVQKGECSANILGKLHVLRVQAEEGRVAPKTSQL